MQGQSYTASLTENCQSFSVITSQVMGTNGNTKALNTLLSVPWHKLCTTQGCHTVLICWSLRTMAVASSSFSSLVDVEGILSILHQRPGNYLKVLHKLSTTVKLDFLHFLLLLPLLPSCSLEVTFKTVNPSQGVVRTSWMVN